MGNTGGDAFITGVDANIKKNEPIQFASEDVERVHRWKAHTEGINYVNYVPEPECFATCSFDCNVFIWNIDCVKIGSLVLGSDKLWNININKEKRNDYERQEAIDLIEEVEQMDYERMFSKQKKEATKDRPLMKALKEEQAEEMLAAEKKFEVLPEDEQNKMILKEMNDNK